MPRREGNRLQHFFGSGASELHLSAIPERKAEEIFRSHAQRLGYTTGRPLSPTTHRSDLRILKRFGTWVQKEGKPQLDRWLQGAWADVEAGDRSAQGAMPCLWRGLRVSEVLNRVVRDLDEDGSVLVIERAKTRAGNRRVDIPEFLRPFVKRLCDGQAPAAWLMRQEQKPGKPRPQQIVHRRARSICRGATA